MYMYVMCVCVCVCEVYMNGYYIFPNRVALSDYCGYTYCPSPCVLLVDVSIGVNKELSEATVTTSFVYSGTVL